MKFSLATRGCIAASAMAIAAGGLLVGAAPAQAAKCIQHGFSVGEVRFLAEDGSELVFFTNGGANASGNGKLGSTDGTIVGGISGTRVDVTYSVDGGRRSYTGTVGDDGVARGTVNNPSAGWISTAITCLKEDAPPPVQEPPPVEKAPVQEPPPVEEAPAPKEGPRVTSEEGLTGVTFTVADRSGVTSQCTYSSEGFKKSFKLPANGSVTFPVPAIRLFTDRFGTVTCDNGTSTNTSVFY